MADSDMSVQYFGLDFTTMSIFFIVVHIFLFFYPIDDSYRGEYILISLHLFSYEVFR